MADLELKKVGNLRLFYQVHMGYPFMLERICLAVEGYARGRGLGIYGPRTAFFHFDPSRFIDLDAWEVRVGRTIIGHPEELGPFKIEDYTGLYCLERSLTCGLDEIRLVYKALSDRAAATGLARRDFWRIAYPRETRGGSLRQSAMMQLFVRPASPDG